MFPKLLPVLFLLTLTASAAPNAVPLPNNDAGAVSATNGQSTLVAWTNMYSVYANNWSVFVRLIDSPFDRNAVYIGPGQSPSVATNGRQYLVGYSYLLSRFNSFLEYDNALVQLVSPEGVLLGRPKAVNHSIFGGLSAVAWTGSHWLVAYYAGSPGSAYAAFLDESLNVVQRLQLGMGDVRALKQIEGRWWAFYGDSLSFAAVELREDRTTGAHFSTAPLGASYNLQLAHGPSPVLLMQHGDRVDAIPFDPFTGFGERRTFLEKTTLVDVAPFNGGSLLLVLGADTRYDTIFMNAAGELTPQLPLIEVPHHSGYNWFGPSRNGLLLFITPRITFPDHVGDLYSYRVPPSRAPIDPATAKLISQKSSPERRRSARH